MKHISTAALKSTLNIIVFIVLVIPLALPTPVAAQPLEAYVGATYNIPARTIPMVYGTMTRMGNTRSCSLYPPADTWMWCLYENNPSETYSAGSSISITSGPSHGIASVSTGGDGSPLTQAWYHTYTPDYGYTGIDSFSVDYYSVTYGAHYYYTLTFNIGPNVAPNNITLSNSSVAENQVINTTVGTLSSTDANEANSFTYSLVGGATGSFNISGATL
jgi:hypothetical protein